MGHTSDMPDITVYIYNYIYHLPFDTHRQVQVRALENVAQYILMELHPLKTIAKGREWGIINTHASAGDEEGVERVEWVSDKQQLLCSVNSYNVNHIKIVCGQQGSVGRGGGRGKAKLPADKTINIYLHTIISL